jgi:predicted MFS family arabinose efflux permease
MESSSEIRLILPTLTMARISTESRLLLTSFLLIEIGQTYGTSIGVTNQINSINSLLSIISALSLGILSVRYDYKKILVSGLVIAILAAAGCCVAPSFLTLVALFSLGGIAGTLIVPITTALIGVHIPSEKRSQALGWLIGGPAIMVLLGVPIINYIGDWRRSFLLFVLPLYFVALLLSYFFVPSLTTRKVETDILAGYREIFSSKSAVACLVGNMLGMGFWMIFLTLGLTYLRTYYSIPRDTVVYLYTASSIVFLFSSVISGKIISRFGLKKMTILSVIGVGIFSISLFAGFSKTISIVSGFVVPFMCGLYQPSHNGLSLGQFPELRGSMMALVSAFSMIGTVIFVGLSGLLLNQYGWRVMILTTGVSCLISGLIVFLFAKEPST